MPITSEVSTAPPPMPSLSRTCLKSATLVSPMDWQVAAATKSTAIRSARTTADAEVDPSSARLENSPQWPTVVTPKALPGAVNQSAD